MYKEYTDQPALRAADRFRGNIGRARDHGIVLKRAHFAITMAEFPVHRMLAGEQTQLGSMKAGLEQVVDRRLELLRAMEDSDGFTNGTDFLLEGHSGTLHLNVRVVGICGRESDAGRAHYRRVVLWQPFARTLLASKARTGDSRSTDRWAGLEPPCRARRGERDEREQET
jgi:hypothetical protein